MSNEQNEFVWLDDQHIVEWDELLALTGLAPEELDQLIQCGALAPENPDEVKWQFKSHWVTSIQTLSRLKRDFELESNSYGLTLVFLERIRKLELEIKTLRSLR